MAEADERGGAPVTVRRPRDLLDEIYATGAVESDRGVRIDDISVSVTREQAEVLTAVVRDERLTRTLETGMAWGLSTVAIAAVHAERGEGEHTAIDPEQSGVWRSVGIANVARAGLDGHVRLLEARADEALPRLAEAGTELDFAFLDGCHLFDFALIDFFYVDLMLRAGGVVAFHDTWMPAVADAVAYVEANRDYEAHPLQAPDMAVLRKRGGDDRAWDHHSPFARMDEAAGLVVNGNGNGNAATNGHGAAPNGNGNGKPVAPKPRVPATTALPRLSFCIATNGNPERVRNLLSVIRPHADELIVAVDRAGDQDVLDAVAPLADRRLTFEAKQSASWVTGWILNQCSGEWILRLDDDEIPSRALLDALPELVADRSAALVELRRRWLFPSPERYISSAPWGEEWQSRLVRGVSGNWRFDGGVHTDLAVTGETRLVDLPIYHADLVLKPYEQRRAKSMEYEVLRPGLEYNDYPVNGLYVPEAADDLETAPVPAADAELIAAVLGDTAPPPAALPPAPAPVEHARAREIAQYNERRAPSDDMHHARIEFARPATRVVAGGVRHHELLITNLGDESWPPGWDSQPLVRIGYRWLDATTGRVTFDGRAVFTETVRPGSLTRVRMAAQTPATPGPYVLEVDLVHEHVRWFECRSRLDVLVVERPVRPLLDLPAAERVELERERSRLALELRDAHRAIAAFQDTRRYRLAQRIGAPADLVRRLRRDSDR